MAAPLDCGSHSALIFQGIPRDAAWKDFALLIYKLQKKVRVFIIDMLDSELAETAVFCPVFTDIWIAEKFYFVS